MKFQIIYDCDKDTVPEDGWYYSPQSSFAVVLDGCSPPYCMPEVPPFTYPDGLTGGQMVTKIIREVFSSALPDKPLEEVLLSANDAVWNIQSEYHPAVSRNDASALASVSFSAAKFDKNSGNVKIIWGADVFTLWLTNQGFTGIAGGDNLESDLHREKTYHDLVGSAGGNPEEEKLAKKKYWLEILPQLKKQQDNVEYAVLNGQESQKVKAKWNVLELEDLEILVLLSDGAWIPIERWHENTIMARGFFHYLQKQSLKDAIDWVLRTQTGSLSSRRVARPEATALVISFD